MISAVMEHRGTVENGSDHFHLSSCVNGLKKMRQNQKHDFQKDCHFVLLKDPIPDFFV